GRDLQVELHELLVADQVGDRLALPAPGDQVAVRRQVGVPQRAVELEVEVGAADAQRGGEEDRRGEPGPGRTGGGQIAGRAAQDLQQAEVWHWLRSPTPLSDRSRR